MSFLQLGLFILAGFLAFWANLRFYVYKKILKPNGVAASYFTGIFTDLSDYFTIVEQAIDPQQKQRHKFLLLSLILARAFLLLVVLLAAVIECDLLPVLEKAFSRKNLSKFAIFLTN